MHEGLYESVVTTALGRELDGLVDLETQIAKVDPADQTHVLTRHLAEAIQRRLAAEKDPDRKLALANELLATVDRATPARRGPDASTPGRATATRAWARVPLRQATEDATQRGRPADQRPWRAVVGSGAQG